MTGPWHYKEAERILALDPTIRTAEDIACAQIHQGLALVAAYACANISRMYPGDAEDWQEAASSLVVAHIVDDENPF